MRIITPDELQPGDLAACWGTDRTSRIISWGTASPLGPAGLRLAPSHVAILTDHPDYGPVWVESTTLCRHPCLFRGTQVSGCQAHLPALRVADYTDAGGRVDIYRLTPIDQFDSAEQDRLRRILLQYFVARGIGYDLGGALLSARRLTTLPRLVCADLEQLFCSEMAAAVLMRLNRLCRRNPSWYHPGRLLREVYRQGTYGPLGTCLPSRPADDPPILPFTALPFATHLP